MKPINVAVIGATGMVGTTLLQILEERNFPIHQLYLYSSAKSCGQMVRYRDQTIQVEELSRASINKPIDIALFAAGGNVSAEFVPLFLQKNIIVVDNSSVFRMKEDVPLVIPEVNVEVLAAEPLLIANPNCSTIQSVLAIKPLYDHYGMERIVYNTYQAVSGSGVKGVEDLMEDKTDNYPHRITQSCLPHIDVFLDNGYTKEEMKMIEETKKILQDTTIGITATTVRVPIRNSHAVSINAALKKSFCTDEVREIIASYPGIVVIDDVKNNRYPLQKMSNGRDDVLVGRIRRDDSIPNGINLWCVADNIRKGAATNAVQIAEHVINNYRRFQ